MRTPKRRPIRDTARLTVKMSPSAKKCLFDMAKAHNMSVSKFVRSCIF